MILLLFWGKVPISNPLGYVADFCRICRKVMPFTVDRVRMVPHFWFIPVGKGEICGHRQRCHGCRAESECFPQTFSTVATATFESVDVLISRTFPAIREVHAKRLALEDRLVRDSDALTPEERQTLLMESFELGAAHYRLASGVEGLRLMVLALRPLNPHEDEIRACLQIYRRRRERIGARLRTADLMELLYADRRPRDPDRFDY